LSRRNFRSFISASQHADNGDKRQRSFVPIIIDSLLKTSLIVASNIISAFSHLLSLIQFGAGFSCWIAVAAIIRARDNPARDINR
jgi:hypothetical protein